MFSFRQFLIEAQRTSARALQLLNRISRMKKFGGKGLKGAINVLTPRSKDDYAGGANSPERYDPQRNRKFSPNTIEGEKFKHHHRGKISLKRLSSAQDRVKTKGVRWQLANQRTSKEVPKVFYKDGEFIVRDGNHRVAAARLRGDKHIRADVFVQRENAISEVSQDLAARYVRRAVPEMGKINWQQPGHLEYNEKRKAKRKAGILRAIERLKMPKK